MCFGGWTLRFWGTWCLHVPWRGKQHIPPRLATIQAYYNIITANCDLLIFTLCELGRTWRPLVFTWSICGYWLYTLSNSTHFVNYTFSSDSRGRAVSERLSYGVDDQTSIPDTCRMFLFSAESQTCPWARQGNQRPGRVADHCLQLVRGGTSPMLHGFTTSWRGAWLRKLYHFTTHEAPRDVINSILVFTFFCIVHCDTIM